MVKHVMKLQYMSTTHAQQEDHHTNEHRTDRDRGGSCRSSQATASTANHGNTPNLPPTTENQGSGETDRQPSQEYKGKDQ